MESLKLSNREISDGIHIDRNKFKKILDSSVVIYNQLSYFGSKKNQIYESLDRDFGENKWIIAHSFDGNIIPKSSAFGVYEKAYYEYLKNNPNIHSRIVENASEVYDIAPSNIKSGLNYFVQECDAIHLQDISVRRVLTRLKLEENGVNFDTDDLPRIHIFKGDHLIQIRGHETEGYFLNPGVVPFHRPDPIFEGDQKGWWNKGSVEDWYQKSKVLLVDPESLNLKLSMISPSESLFSKEDNFYKASCLDSYPSHLTFLKGKKARKLYSENKNYSMVNESPEHNYSEWMQLAPKHSIKRNINSKDI